MLRTAFLAATAAVLATQVSALDVSDAMQDYLDNSIRAWSQDPAIVDAIVEQNVRTAGFDGAMITDLDLAWRAEVGTANTPTIDAVLGAPLSDFLRAQVAASGGTITEVFVMDSVGLNVGSSGVTSDYWQGDEAKFTETYGIGPDAVHFSEIEFDESSQSYQAQISIPVVDAAGAVIGAITVGVNADSLL